MEKHEIDINAVEELSQDLKALTSLLYALADAEDVGFMIDSYSLNHLGQLAADCNQKLHDVLNV